MMALVGCSVIRIEICSPRTKCRYRILSPVDGSHLQSDEDIEQILRIAVRQGGADMSAPLRDRLLASAAELGISESQLAAAEKQYRASRDLELDLAKYKQEVRSGFMGHVLPYVLVNLFLIFLSLKEGEFWFVYPLFGWGIGLAFHAMSAFNTSSQEFQREFEEWRAKKRQESRRPRNEDEDDDDD